MAKPELSQRTLADSLGSSRNQIKIRSSILKYSNRIQELSQPKLRHMLDEEIVGPGSYTPNNLSLSTYSKSPTVSIGRSERFIKTKLSSMKEDIRRIKKQRDLSYINHNISDMITPPKYSFKRTGHKLELAGNPDFPGVGKYSPVAESVLKSFSFTKATKAFDWKKGKSYLANHGWLF
ncbi:hypothetical protein SteCoe_17348 [Stentor coeruleus]|uniref:Uncharacterized protein n=1 Tax=Stentor coeruleus TaxID=5963 RepID=A0A1R2BZI4_9CILI|nr:hypothetical protein SteCoe_17348 [Stentor coeruleus]